MSVPSIGLKIDLPSSLKILEFFACIEIDLIGKSFTNIGKLFVFDVMYFCVCFTVCS